MGKLLLFYYMVDSMNIVTPCGSIPKRSFLHHRSLGVNQEVAYGLLWSSDMQVPCKNMRYASQRRGQRAGVLTQLLQILMNGYFAGMKIWRVGTQITEHYDPVLAPVGALKCFERRGHHVFMNCFMHLWSTGLPKPSLTLNSSLFRKASCLHSQVTAMGKRYCWASLKVTCLTFHKVKLYVKPKSEMPSDLNPDLLWFLCMFQDHMR